MPESTEEQYDLSWIRPYDTFALGDRVLGLSEVKDFYQFQNYLKTCISFKIRNLAWVEGDSFSWRKANIASELGDDYKQI